MSSIAVCRSWKVTIIISIDDAAIASCLGVMVSTYFSVQNRPLDFEAYSILIGSSVHHKTDAFAVLRQFAWIRTNRGSNHNHIVQLYFICFIR